MIEAQTTIECFLHDFRKQIDGCIAIAEGNVRGEPVSKYIREMSLARTKLQEAKMWVGKCLEALGSEFPKELRDKAGE